MRVFMLSILSDCNLNQNINAATGFRENLQIKPTFARVDKMAGRGTGIRVLDPQGYKGA